MSTSHPPHRSRSSRADVPAVRSAQRGAPGPTEAHGRKVASKHAGPRRGRAASTRACSDRAAHPLSRVRTAPACECLRLCYLQFASPHLPIGPFLCNYWRLRHAVLCGAGSGHLLTLGRTARSLLAELKEPLRSGQQGLCSGAFSPHCAPGRSSPAGSGYGQRSPAHRPAVCGAQRPTGTSQKPDCPRAGSLPAPPRRPLGSLRGCHAGPPAPTLPRVRPQPPDSSSVNRKCKRVSFALNFADAHFHLASCTQNNEPWCRWALRPVIGGQHWNWGGTVCSINSPGTSALFPTSGRWDSAALPVCGGGQEDACARISPVSF